MFASIRKFSNYAGVATKLASASTFGSFGLFGNRLRYSLIEVERLLGISPVCGPLWSAFINLVKADRSVGHT